MRTLTQRSYTVTNEIRQLATGEMSDSEDEHHEEAAFSEDRVGERVAEGPQKERASYQEVGGWRFNEHNHRRPYRQREW